MTLPRRILLTKLDEIEGRWSRGYGDASGDGADDVRFLVTHLREALDEIETVREANVALGKGINELWASLETEESRVLFRRIFASRGAAGRSPRRGGSNSGRSLKEASSTLPAVT